MAETRCMGCGSETKGPDKYLGRNCWGSLSVAARRALNRRDSKATARVQDLYRQIRAGVPLGEIQVSP
jgi:hypothetical protein